jgi:hypothetical protein
MAGIAPLVAPGDPHQLHPSHQALNASNLEIKGLRVVYI